MAIKVYINDQIQKIIVKHNNAQVNQFGWHLRVNRKLDLTSLNICRKLWCL